MFYARNCARTGGTADLFVVHLTSAAICSFLMVFSYGRPRAGHCPGAWRIFLKLSVGHFTPAGEFRYDMPN